MKIFNTKINRILFLTMLFIGITRIMFINFKIRFLELYTQDLTEVVGSISHQQELNSQKITTVRPYIELLKIKNKKQELQLKKKVLEKEIFINESKLGNILTEINK